MYERTTGYSNVCLSVHDHIIKFWLWSHVFGSETPRSKCKGMHLVLKKGSGE
jgi:hypothetical protein